MDRGRERRRALDGRARADRNLSSASGGGRDGKGRQTGGVRFRGRNAVLLPGRGRIGPHHGALEGDGDGNYRRARGHSSAQLYPHVCGGIRHPGSLPDGAGDRRPRLPLGPRFRVRKSQRLLRKIIRKRGVPARQRHRVRAERRRTTVARGIFHPVCGRRRKHGRACTTGHRPRENRAAGSR